MASVTSKPSSGYASIGDLSNAGRLISCGSIDGVVYAYVGTSDGIAAYKTLGELRELDHEAEA